MLLFILLSLAAYNRSSAQAFDSSLMISPSAVRNTSFTAYFLADSFSKAGDSIQTSACLMRMEPYYLMYQAISPANLDTFFSEYKLTVRAKGEFRKKFEAVFNTPRTSTYGKFEEQFREDQQTRRNMDMCNDSISCAVFQRNMKQADSVHFDYLFRYVNKYGWPKLADGGLYAEFIALHDATDGHWMYYLPLMKKAVLAGQANYNMYHNVLNRAVTPNFEKLSRNYKKIRFDISYILKSDPPSNAQMELMKEAIRKYKPIKYFYFLYESNNEKDYEIFTKAKGGHSHGRDRGWDKTSYCIAWDLMVDLEYYQKDLLSSDFNPFYQFAYEQSSYRKKKLIMYLLY